MNAPKSTSTALARVLALPLMAGLLAGCDYASKLPDAPSSLGYELQAQKPPSVTEPRGAPDLMGPPPPPSPSIDVAALAPPTLGGGLDTRALQVSPQGLEVPRGALELPPSRALPPPTLGTATQGVGQSGFATLDAAGRDSDGYTAPQNDFAAMEYDGPTLGIAAPEPQFAEYTSVPFENEPMFADAPMSVTTEPVIASLPAQPSYDQPSYDQPSYDQASYDQPTYETTPYDTQAFEPQTSNVLYSPDSQPFDSQPYDTQPYSGAIGELTTVQTVPFVSSAQPLPMAPASPITVLHTRLDNGAVVSVHPVVGAPGGTSMALSRAIASELGATVDGSELAFAPAVFDLRASASGGGGRPEAEWKLFSGSGALVGIFPESEPSGTWTSMGDAAVRGMGRRVASRLRRNAELRRATLNSVASAPPITSIDYSAVLPGGAPSLAPMPQPRPVRMAQLAPVRAAPMQTVAIPSAPMQPVAMATLQPLAPLQPAPVQQYVVNTAPLLASDPMANAVPRRRPEGVRTASLSPTSIPARPAPLPPIQPVAMAPLAPMAPLQPITAAPPPPSFDTLRAATDTASIDGPRALVFRGVRGAPGNGDQALGREVSRLLGQSGAQLAPSGTPDALYLTADVSRSRNGANDSIKIMWHVEEADGTRVGQVVQENDVPAGALDANWGEDAFYAAQGARDGIMELLRTSGAIDA